MLILKNCEISLNESVIYKFRRKGNDCDRGSVRNLYKEMCFWFLIKAKLLANYWRQGILVCLQSVVTNAINIRTNRFSARTLGAGLDQGHDEAFFL